MKGRGAEKQLGLKIAVKVWECLGKVSERVFHLVQVDLELDQQDRSDEKDLCFSFTF